jgi:2-polyprenyl-3-methyl-5-hydroxy-6-metoxy-1,4-benzoquinol methylase
MFTNDTGNAESRIKSHEVLFEHYRTIAYEGANPFRPEQVVRDTDPSFGKLLPTNLDARILDIGCGMGHFLHYLNLKGYRNLMGVELSPEQVDFCQKTVNTNIVLISDLVAFLSERPQSWECIIFKDVIEHLPRIQVIPTLSAIFQALTPGGTVIVETGNLASPAGMFVRYIDFTHESGFTENSLRQVLRAVGFSEITIRGNSPVIYSWRSYIRVAAQRTWHQCLRLMYSLDRGLSAAPKVLSPVLIGHAVRPRQTSGPSVAVEAPQIRKT